MSSNLSIIITIILISQYLILELCSASITTSMPTTIPTTISIDISSMSSTTINSIDSATLVEENRIITTTTEIPTTTTAINKQKNQTKMFSLANTIKLDTDFKPKYNGRVIPRTELNLTEKAKKVLPEPDYYDYGEGEGADLDDDDDDYQPFISSTSTTTTTTTTIYPNKNDFEESYEEKDLDDVDLAVGGITGIIEKILHGPKKDELNPNSQPESVYVFLSRIISEESAKAFKATIPRIYDYQFPIGNRLSQRCFNSFAQFGDRLRKHYIWPIKMSGSSASFSLNRFALREYGDFDSCLNILADDESRRSNEILYVGQYCMVKVEFPLPFLNRTVTIRDKIFNFNNTEISGTFSEYFLLNAPFLYSNPFSYGLCLPSTCSPKEMESVADFFLEKMQIKVRFTSDCYSRLNMTVDAMPEELTELNSTYIYQLQQFSIGKFFQSVTKLQIFAILYVIISICLVGLASIYEVYHIYLSANQWKSQERNRPKSFIACFSLYYNIEQIFKAPKRYQKKLMNNLNMDSDKLETNCQDSFFDKQFGKIVNNTTCLDAIKTVALVWICLSNFYLLGYQSQMLSSIPHLRETVLSLRTNFFYQIVIQSWLSNEIFFLISGFLLAYTQLPLISQKDGRPKLVPFFIKRLIRFVPSMIFLLLVINLLPLWKNAGPLYNSGIENILGQCGKYYWRSLLFMSNFYNSDQVCLPYLWYISNEFQLFTFGIFVLIFTYNRSHLALKTYGILILIGCTMSAYAAYKLKFSSSAMIFETAILEEIPVVIKALHFHTIVHFSSYFTGMALGYYIRMNPGLKPFNFTLITRISMMIILIIISSSFVIYIPLIWSLIMDKVNENSEKTFAIMYFGSSRLLFVGSSIWIISQCLPRRNFITKVLSWSIFRICSHISFQIYLLNLIIIWIYLFTKRTLLETNLMESFPVALSLFIMTCILSMFTYLLFEAPYRSLHRYYFESPRIVVSHTAMKSINFNKNDRIIGNSEDNIDSTTTTFTKELDLNGNLLVSRKLNQIRSNSENSKNEQTSVMIAIKDEHPNCYTNPMMITNECDSNK